MIGVFIMDLKKPTLHLPASKKGIREEKIEYKKGQVLVDKNSFGKERPWQKLKIENLRYSEYLEILKIKKAFNVRSCAEELDFQVDENGQKKLYRVWFCKSRLCPMCNWRRAVKSSKQLELILAEATKREPQARFLFLTLTTKNTFGKENLKAELSKMGRAVAKLMQYKKISKSLLGYVRSTEITVSRDGSYHQHMHVLLMVTPKFFKEKDRYIKQKEWIVLWKKAMKLDYDPSVHIEAVRDKKGKGSLKSAALETAKYQTKSSDYMTKNDAKNLQVIDDLEYALRGTRQISFAGLLKEVRKDLCLDDVEKGDLIHADGKNSEESSVIKVAIAKFDFFRKNYFWT
uniref:protein rep n=1 Tax=Lactobacillus sp. TaxID=1591 RepID=UPI0020D1F990|nr:protein rep [Lactobacillus sp.]